MVQLKYKSLVTKENINYYLSLIKDEREKEDFINTISKFDIRISTKPVIKGEEFYYKIWILRRGTKKKAHIKQYYPLNILKKFTSSSSHPLTLSEILDMIQINAYVPDDFEEYCEIRLEDPSDEVCRMDYLDDLRRAKRFKRFITQEEIRSLPSIVEEEKNKNKQNNEKEEEIRTIDFNDESDLELLGYSFVFLNDKREYDKLAELQNTLNYHARIVESYGYDTYTGDFNEKEFPITKEDKHMESIAKDFKNYFKTCLEYGDYLKELIKRYNIRPSGNILKRVAFTLKNDNLANPNSNYITTTIDYQTFS